MEQCQPEDRIKIAGITILFAVLIIILAFAPSYIIVEITDKYIRTYEYDKKKKRTRLSGFAYWEDIDGWYYYRGVDYWIFYPVLFPLRQDDLYIYKES